MNCRNSSTPSTRRSWGWLKTGLLGAALVLFGSAQAQLALTRSIFTGGYSAITTGGGATAVAGVANTDDGGGAVTIGFTFNYLGTPYTTATANTNGWLSFGTQFGSSWVNSNLYGVGTGPTVAPWWDDLYAIVVGSNPVGQCLYQTTGLAGSQVCTVQWDVSASTSGTPRFIHFQAKLYEGTNVIEFLYDTPTGGTVTNTIESACIGLRNNTGGNNNYLDAVTGSSNTGNSQLQSDRWPSYNFRFTPGAPSVLAGGTYNVGVGQTYRNLNEAAADVNHRGISGAVTFNLTDAQYDITSANGGNFFPVLLGAITGTSASNTITFTKSGTAAIVQYGGTTTYGGNGGGFIGNAGSPTGASGLTSNTDPIIGLVGADYVTLNNLDIRGNTGNNLSDHGIGLYNSSPTDGATFNTIQNVTVQMAKTNTGSRGFLSNVPSTPSSAAGANSNNVFKDFVIKNVYAGIQMTGNATFPDVNNQITRTNCATFNTIGDPATANDIGNAGTATYGIQLSNQSGFICRNNMIRNVTVTAAVAVDGINVVLYQGIPFLNNNIIRGIRSGSTASNTVSGIKMSCATAGTNRMYCYNNAISELTCGYTGAASATRMLRGISVLTGGTAPSYYDIYHNSVSINGSGSLNASSACLEFGTSTGPVFNVKDNIFANFTPAQTSPAMHVGVLHTSSTTTGPAGTAITNNDIYIPNGAGVSGWTAFQTGTSAGYNGSAAWNAAFPTEVSNNFDHDPQFTDPLANLHSGAAGNNAAGAPPPGYYTIDLDCATRTPDNDIGAYIINGCSGATAGSITGANSACSAAPVTLNLTGSSTGLGISYQWKYGPVGGPYTNLLGTGISQSTSSLVAGTYGIVVDVTCASGPVTSTTAEFAFTMKQTPSATAGSNSPVCVGQPLNLTGTTDIGTTFAWTGPLSYTSTSQSPQVSASATSGMAGTYSFTATLNGCTSAPGTTVVTINSAPAITVSPASATICSGGSVTLNAQQIGTASLATVLSSLNTNSASILSSIPTPSGFTDGVTGTTIGDGCNDMWDTGNQLNSNLGTAFAYSNNAIVASANLGAGGQYFTRLLGSNVCGTSATVFLWAGDINGLTSLSITGNLGADGVGGQNLVSFPITANGLSYTAFVKRVFGAPDPSVNQLFLIPTPNGASQAMGLTNDDNLHTISGLTGVTRFYYMLFAGVAGVQYTDVQVTAIAQTLGNAIPNSTVPFPGTVVWSPNGETTTSISATAAGTYTVTGTLGGCSAQASSVVTVNAPITSASITGALSFCAGGSTTLTAVPADGVAPYTYLWSPGGQTTASIVVTTGGSYSAQVTDACTGSVNTGSVSVTAKPVPTATAGSNSPVCTGNPLNLTGTTDIGTSFSWTGPNSYTSTSQNPQVSASATFAMSGNYTFTASLNGCTSTPSVTAVVVNETPTISSVTATPGTICPGGTSTLAATASALGQTSSYTNSTITFAPIATPGTGVTTLTNAGVATPAVSGSSLDDGYWPNNNIPFTFAFNGALYTQFSVSTNGFITFGGGAPNTWTGYSTTLPSTASGRPAAFAVYADLDFRTAGAIRYFSSGSAPNRKMCINWTGGQFYNGIVGSVITAQVILYETTNVIEMHITQSTANNGACEGLQNAAGTTAYLVPGRNYPTAWPVTNDGQRFTPSGGTLSYAWAPAGDVVSPTSASTATNALPASETFTVTATFGTCSAQGTTSVTVPTVDDGDPCTLDACTGNGVVTHTFQDADGDLTCDANDGCPNDPNKIAPGVCGCGVADTDSDGDGTANCIDGCPADPTKIAPGVCGCGVADTDSDGDGTANCIDGCPADPTKIAPGVCGCGVADTDSDGDGTANCIDGCPADPTKIAPGLCGCGVPEGTCNDCEGVPAGPAQPGTPCDDTNACTINDTWSNACVCIGTFQDTDGDGICNANDNCPNLAGVQGDACTDGNVCTINDVITAGCVCAGTFQDTDGDGICNANDNCPNLFGQQGDACTDGDVCTINDVITAGCVCAGTFQDTDGDGICNANDNCPNLAGVQGDACTDGDACTINDVISASCVCAGTFQDTDGDGVCDANDNCPTVVGQQGDACDDGDGLTTGDVIDANCECHGSPCTQNGMALTFDTDNDGEQISWSIVDQTTTTTVCQGSGLPDNTTITVGCCLPDGCYDLIVTDMFGDGIHPGGFVLRDGTGQRVIDNGGNGHTFSSVSKSALGFCLPLSAEGMVPSSCDIENATLSTVLHAQPNAVVTAFWTPSNFSQQGYYGYQYWVTNPHGGFSRRITLTLGAPGSAAPPGTPANLKPTYFALSSMNSSAPFIPRDILLNVRVRAYINGVYGLFGPACRLRIPYPPCATTQLTTTANPVVSCGATGLTLSSTIYADAVTGATQYQFEFTKPGYTRRIVQTVRSTALNFVTNPLQNNNCYQVRVRVSIDGAQTYCPFGPYCTITIGSGVCAPPSMALEPDNEVLTSHGEARVALWPNPNDGSQVQLSLMGFSTELSTVAMDVTDVFGQVVATRTIPVQDGQLMTTIDFENSLAPGLYLVNLQVGEERHTERLMIQH